MSPGQRGLAPRPSPWAPCSPAPGARVGGESPEATRWLRRGDVLRLRIPRHPDPSGRSRRLQLTATSSAWSTATSPSSATESRPETLRAWLAAYAAATASTTSYNTLLEAATPGQGDKPAKTTTIAYRDTLAHLSLLDPVPGWTPGYGHLGRLGQAPKHHLADPALAATLLGVDAPKLISGADAGPHVPRDGTLLGALFESLVTLSVRVYAQLHEAQVSHLRLRDGRHEVDLIVERPDGAVVAVEVKLGGVIGDDDVKHLLWLRDHLGDRLLDAVVVSTGPTAYRRQDGIAVVPAALLGA